jgi:hypothetical protein
MSVDLSGLIALLAKTRNSLFAQHAAGVAVVSWRHGLPLLRQQHHLGSVHHAVPEQVVELKADTFATQFILFGLSYHWKYTLKFTHLLLI